MLTGFRNRGFLPWLVKALFKERDVEYKPMPALGNPHLGSHPNPGIVRERYWRHVRQQTAALAELGACLDAGTVLLLGRGREHQGTDREILVSAFAEIGSTFELVMVVPDTAPCIVEISVPSTSKSADKPDEEKTVRRRRKRTRNQQMILLDPNTSQD